MWIKKYHYYLIFAAIFLFLWLILRTSTREYLTSQEKIIGKQINSGLNKLKKIVRKYERTGKLTKENVGAFRTQYLNLMQIGMIAQAKGISNLNLKGNIKEIVKMKGINALLVAATGSGSYRFL